MMYSLGLYPVPFGELCPSIKPGAVWVVGAGAPVFRRLKFHKKNTSCDAGSMTR